MFNKNKCKFNCWWMGNGVQHSLREINTTIYGAYDGAPKNFSFTLNSDDHTANLIMDHIKGIFKYLDIEMIDRTKVSNDSGKITLSPQLLIQGLSGLVIEGETLNLIKVEIDDNGQAKISLKDKV
jgi:hypothetical protein